MSARPLRHPLLLERGIAHGFGVRGAHFPADLVRPEQVHGARIATSRDCSATAPCPADGVVSNTPGVSVGVATADCLPILLATSCGGTVAAVHAGWRGLAAGVVDAGVAAVRELAGSSARLVAAIGPHIGPCCYEVDAPVLDAMALRYASVLESALRPSRPGHARLDLAALAWAALVACGVAAADVGVLPDACTRCDPERFYSHRRDGSGTGRLIHYITVRPASGRARRLDTARTPS